jgi:hypothetical protein
MWIRWDASLLVTRDSLLVSGDSILDTRFSILVAGDMSSAVWGEITDGDTIGEVLGEGLILDAASRARALALRFGRVASQRTAATASVTPIARPILKSFCIHRHKIKTGGKGR